MKHSFKSCCEQGYWYCTRCEKIVVLGDEEESPAKCPRCKKKTAEWQVPVNLNLNN